MNLEVTPAADGAEVGRIEQGGAASRYESSYIYVFVYVYGGHVQIFCVFLKCLVGANKATFVLSCVCACVCVCTCARVCVCVCAYARHTDRVNGAS